MSLKMQADINLLMAHYNELEERLEEAENQVALLNHGIHTLVGGGDLNKLRLIKEDKTPLPKTRSSLN